MDDAQRQHARTLRALHHLPEGRALVLPNAWDGASAVLAAQAGAAAVATTSGGVAWSAGRPDGQGLTREEMAESVRRIVRAVDVPVTADVEGGYGPGPDDVAATVSAVVAAGAVGVNLEDSVGPQEPLFDVAVQSDRLRAARAAAEHAGLPELWINARTDVFLFGTVEPVGRAVAEVLTRAEAYAAAGVDSLFVPGLGDLATIATLVEKCPLPVNVMVGPGAPSVAELEAVGVRRVSVGTAVAQAAYGVARRAMAELLATGRCDAMAGGLDYGTLNAAVTR